VAAPGGGWGLPYRLRHTCSLSSERTEYIKGSATMYYINLDSMSDIDIDEHERQADGQTVVA